MGIRFGGSVCFYRAGHYERLKLVVGDSAVVQKYPDIHASEGIDGEIEPKGHPVPLYFLMSSGF